MQGLLFKHFLFWGLPTAYTLIVMGLYFSGSQALVDLVTPRTMTAPWSEYGDRELGILENTQHLLLLASIVIMGRGLSQAKAWPQRLGMLSAFLMLCFALLEEIDYGTHYWDFITGDPVFDGDVNFHNNSGTTGTMKQLTDVVMVIWFVVLPLMAPQSKSAWLKYLAPTRMFIFTLVAAVCVSRLAHYLDENGFAIRNSLSNNISEFRELFTYYSWFLYCLLMARQPWPGRHPPAPVNLTAAHDV